MKTKQEIANEVADVCLAAIPHQSRELFRKNFQDSILSAVELGYKLGQVDGLKSARLVIRRLR